MATAAETRVRSCRGPERRLNKARIVRAVPAVSGWELSDGCRTKVCLERRNLGLTSVLTLSNTDGSVKEWSRLTERGGRKEN